MICSMKNKADRYLMKKSDSIDFNHIFIPVHQHEIHWLLLIVKVSNRKIYFIDSLAKESKILRDQTVKYVKTYFELKDAQGKLKRSKKLENQKSPEWKATKVRCPQQTNTYDCGVFM